MPYCRLRSVEIRPKNSSCECENEPGWRRVDLVSAFDSAQDNRDYHAAGTAAAAGHEHVPGVRRRRRDAGPLTMPCRRRDGRCLDCDEEGEGRAGARGGGARVDAERQLPGAAGRYRPGARACERHLTTRMCHAPTAGRWPLCGHPLCRPCSTPSHRLACSRAHRSSSRTSRARFARTLSKFSWATKSRAKSRLTIWCEPLAGCHPAPRLRARTSPAHRPVCLHLGATADERTHHFPEEVVD